MKKTMISMAAVSMMVLSCSTGSASSPGGQTGESGKPVNLTKQDFLEKVMNYEKNQTEWVYEGDKPALIDFYADWCGPCRIAAPVLEELAKEYEGRIHVYKVDTEKERELAAVFGIQSIPAFLFVPKDGRPSMSRGIAQTPEATKEMFRQMIDEILLGKKPKVESQGS
jgi:thioredoxin 1